HRPGLVRGLGPAAAAFAVSGGGGPPRGGHRVRAIRAGRGAAAHPGRARGHRVRAGRRPRRAAALRDPRVQDGKAPPGPPALADAGRGNQVPLRRDRGAGRRGPPAPGAALSGVPQAMQFLPLANRAVVASQSPTGGGPVPEPPISARGKNVIIIRGGDTGADCLGTAHRQGAASVTQLEILPRPTQSRPDSQPWPTYPMIYRVSSAHEEGGERTYAVTTLEFLGDDSDPGGRGGRVRALRLAEAKGFDPVPGTEHE